MSKQTHCNQCGSSRSKEVKKYTLMLKLPDAYSVLECQNCQLVFMHPQPTDEVLDKVYSEYDKDYDFISVTKDRVRHEYQHCLDLAKKHKIDKGRVLDIGAGVGGFLHVFKAAGYEVTGTEYSESIIALAKKTYGLEIEKRSLEDLAGKGAFDIIHSHHVLEHVRDPKLYFDQVGRLLKDEGLFMFEVPNEFWSVILKIRKWIGRPNKYPVYPSLHHLYFYRKEVLVKYLKQNNLKLLKYKSYHPRHQQHPNFIYRTVVDLALKLLGSKGFGPVHFMLCKKAG